MGGISAPKSWWNCWKLQSFISPIEINPNDQCQWEWITSYDHLLNVMLHLASRSLGQQLHELRTLVAPRLRIIPARTHAAMEEPGREEFMLPSANMEITKDQTMKLYEVMYTEHIDIRSIVLMMIILSWLSLSLYMVRLYRMEYLHNSNIPLSFGMGCCGLGIGCRRYTGRTSPCRVKHQLPNAGEPNVFKSWKCQTM